VAQTHTNTAIGFQGGSALGAYAFGALKYIYASEPGFRPSCVSGVSIEAFTAAISPVIASIRYPSFRRSGTT
jgi:predicted acylesterase/phospholipase RssA